jgi:hypothetical protein
MIPTFYLLCFEAYTHVFTDDVRLKMFFSFRLIRNVVALKLWHLGKMGFFHMKYKALLVFVGFAAIGTHVLG